MDPSKKKALLKWIAALGNNTFESFEDLRDGRHIISILKSSDHLIDADASLDTTDQRFDAIQQYLEGFYNQSLVETKLLDFAGIIHNELVGDKYDLEMGKLLLALLGGLIQDNTCRERIIQPALGMDERTQYEIKEMMELTLLMDSRLPQGFEDMLRSKTDEGDHHDAALFFKLVADGGLLASPKSSPSTPIAAPPGNHPPPCNGPVFAMYSNSPQPATSAGVSIRDISSPLRVMSLSSPVTPLGALMSSPQLAQKIIHREVDRRKDVEALLRQKLQENKRLELALQSEQHMRSELELDLQQANRLTKEKDGRIQECERRFSEVRKLRDQLDELELLRAEKENLGRDVTRLQARVLELQDVREHNAMLERESRDTLFELERAREELKLLETLRRSSEEFRVKAHKLQLEVSEYKASLQHARCELEGERAMAREAQAMYDTAQYTCNALRREKDELEEMLGTRNGMIDSSFVGGETMSVVTEKRMSELQLEYDQMKASWVDPALFSDVKQRLELESEAKKAYEEKYIEMKKRCLCADSDVEKLTSSVDQYRASVARLDAIQQVDHATIIDLRSQVTSLQEQEATLRRSESDLQGVRGQLETRIQGLEKELSQCNAKLHLTRREIEVHMEESDNRRQTILQLDSQNQEKVQAEHRLSTELSSWRRKAEHATEQLSLLKEEGQRNEATLKTKLQSTQDTLSETESTLESERIERDIQVKGLNEKLSTFETDLNELNETLDKEKRLFRQKVTELENKIETERTLSEERLDSLNSVKKDFEEHKDLCRCREESLTLEVNTLRKEKKCAEFECHKLKLEQQSADESFSNKYQKLEERLAGFEAAYKQELVYLTSCSEEKDRVHQCLKTEICDLQRTIEKQKSNIESINNIIEQFKSDNSELGEGLGHSKLEVVDLKLQLKNLGEKHVEEIEKNTSLQNELNTILSKSDKLRKDYECRICDFEERIREKEAEKNDYERRVSDFEGLISEKEAEKNDYERRVSDFEERIREKEAEKNDYERRVSDFEGLVHEKEAEKNDYERRVSDFEGLISEKVAEIVKFRQEHAALVNENNSKMAAVQEELSTLRETEKSLRSSLIVGEASFMAMQNMVQEKEQEKTKTDLLLKEKDDRISAIDADLAAARESVSTARLELQALIGEHEAAISSLNTNHEQAVLAVTSESQARQQEADREREALEGQVNRLGTELQNKSDACVELERKCETIASDAESVRAEVEIKVADIVDSHKELTQQLNLCRSKFDQQKDEFERKIKQLRLLNEDLEESLQTSNSTTDDLRQNLLSTEQHWQSQCEQIKAASLKEQERMIDQVNDLRVSLQAQTEQCEELQKKCEIMACDKEFVVANLSGEIDSLTAKVSESQAAVEHSSQTIHDLQVRVKALDECKSCLESDLAADRTELENATTQLASQLVQKQDLDQQIEQLILCRSKFDQQKDEFERKIKQLRLLNEDLEESLQTNNSTTDDLRQNLLSTEQHWQSQCEQIKAAALKEQERMIDQVNDLRVSLQAQTEQCEELQKKCEIMACDKEFVVANLSGEIDSLTAKVSESQAAVEHSSQTIHDLQVRVKALDECKSCLESDLAADRTELESATTQLASQLVQIDSLTAKVSESQAAVEHSSQTIHDLQVRVKALDECKSCLESDLAADRTELESATTQLASQLVQKQDLDQQIEQLILSKSDLEQSLVTCKSELASQRSAFEDRVEELRGSRVELEDYWRVQCEQLEDEYSRGAAEQRVEYEAAREEHDAQLQDALAEKDINLAGQQQGHQERVLGLEKVIAERRREVNTATQELEGQKQRMAELEVRYKEQLARLTEQLSSVSESLKSETELHRQSVCECETWKQKVSEVEESKKAAVEMLIGQYETQLDCLKANEVDVQKLTREHKTERETFESEVDSQKCTYQSIILSLEEKLRSETSDLKERLSQMKCQYETVIENKDKETRTQLRDYEAKCSSLQQVSSSMEAKCSSLQQASSSMEASLSERKDENIQLQADLVMCSNKNSELAETLAGCQGRLAEASGRAVGQEERLEALQEELAAVQVEARAGSEQLGQERGERAELERQLAYLRDQTDTLTAELSSQQQQLAAVEEETRVLEVDRQTLVMSHESAVAETQRQADKARQFEEVEKLEVERQLQSLQKCYETVQKSDTESEQRVARLQLERGQMDTRCHELETRIHNYMAREAKMTTDHLHEMNKAAELNQELRRQVDQKCRALSDANAKFTKQLEDMQREANEMQHKLKSDIQAMLEDKTALEIEVATLQQVKDKLKTTEADRQRLQDVNEKYNIHYNKKKETIVELTRELTQSRKQMESALRAEQKMAKETAPLLAKLEAERNKTKALMSKLRTLEAQYDLADRKLREYHSQLEKGSSVFLGDNTHFMQMVMDKQSSSDASFMENHPSSVPLDDSLIDGRGKNRYDLRNRRSSCSSSVDQTMTPGMRASRSRSKLSKSASTATVLSNGMTPGAASIGSTTSLAHRLRFRESVSSLDKSVSSVSSTASNVPRGTGGLFHCDDEPNGPMDFEWGRLGELQRRNTLCPSHMKTSYPVETQSCRPRKFTEDALRESTIASVNKSPIAPGSGRKRKTMWDSTDSGSDSSDSKKLAKGAGTVYQKPGPPTPANCRRNSGKGTSKSPSKRNSCIGTRSPRTPLGIRGKRTPRRTPRQTPKTSVHDLENIGSGKKANTRESIAFSVGFSPKASCKRLRRQDGFITQKQPQSSSQTRKPLGTRNYMQTGV